MAFSHTSNESDFNQRPAEPAQRLRVVCAVARSLDTTPSQRYRWEQWQQGLVDYGIDLEFLSFCTPGIDQALRSGHKVEAALGALRRYPNWLWEVERARDADIIVILRKMAPAGPIMVERFAASGRARLVYDFDDAIFLEPAGMRSKVSVLLDPASRCKSLCSIAHCVTVGNSFLGEFASQFASRVELIPTTVNTLTHTPRLLPRPADALPIVGWSGSKSTGRYLEAMLPLIERVQREVPFELLVVGAQLELGSIHGRCVPWSSAREVELLQEMDIGLMPLENSDWEKGKCALKALLYGAVGIPALVSDVGANSEAVLHMQTGIVAKDDAEWMAGLKRLLLEEDLRLALGHNARQHIISNYSTERWVPDLARVLWGVAA